MTHETDIKRQYIDLSKTDGILPDESAVRVANILRNRKERRTDVVVALVTLTIIGLFIWSRVR